MMFQCPKETISERRGADLLRWLLVIALTTSLAAPAPALLNDESSDAPASVLDLQRLVDQMLAESPKQSDGSAATNVLDLQRALLKTVRSDSPRQEQKPTREKDAVLPPPIRFHVPTAPVATVALGELPGLGHAAPAPPATELLPTSAGTRLRYQFHLLANAPPR
ncbi:MAG: hypothetical protein L3K26_11165 [Candidatus Hydrogenedentes bacterium]|nr:hypothetical protein [Candidatus Hydrogenedentota bacterium]